jgi:hypothetical protein
MRYLLCTALLLAACERRDAGRDVVVDDTLARPMDTTIPAAAPDRAMSAVADRLIGTWTAKGYDAGSTKPQLFTLTWDRSPDGSLAGRIAFKPGDTYNVKVVSTSDTMIVYESEPHSSPTLKGQVVTRTEAKFVGDSLVGNYTAKATSGGKTLRGRFTATHGAQ